MIAFEVGDRVDSTFGREHRGIVVEVKSFSDGAPMYLVRQDSDGFVWVGMTGTMLPVIEAPV